MPTGNQTVASLSGAIPRIIASARIVREYESVMARVVQRNRLSDGQGTDWIEDRVNTLVAQNVTENTVLENAQRVTETTFSVTPLVSGIKTIVTDRTRRRISKNVASLIGKAAQRAMERKKDTDGLAQFANATTTLAGTTVTLTSGHVSAGVAQILGNTTESGKGAGPIALVLHPYGIKDLQNELVAGVGTYTIPEGLTAEIYRRGFMGTVFGANVWEDGNIAINSTPDARGAIFARDGLVLVEGFSPRSEVRRRPDIGGGAEEVFLYDEYAFGERRAVWVYGLLHDATAPTS